MHPDGGGATSTSCLEKKVIGDSGKIGVNWKKVVHEGKTVFLCKRGLGPASIKAELGGNCRKEEVKDSAGLGAGK